MIANTSCFFIIQGYKKWLINLWLSDTEVRLVNLIVVGAYTLKYKVEKLVHKQFSTIKIKC